MAKPLTPDQLMETFRKWGVPFHEVPGWRTRTRPGRTISPIGCMDHHTGDDLPDDVDQKVIINGYTSLHGPLANLGGRDDGSVDLIAMGYCNHAGGGDVRVLDAVINENYGDAPPAPRYTHEQATIFGNDKFYGRENYYYKILTDKSYRGRVLAWAAICDAHGWSEKRVIGHKEWQRGKIDPAGFVMANLRADVKWCLQAGPAAASEWFRTGVKNNKPNTPDPVSHDRVQSAGFYTVQDGDTLYAIATDFKTTVAQLMSWNKYLTTLIKPGQKVRVVAPVVTAPTGPAQHTSKWTTGSVKALQGILETAKDGMWGNGTDTRAQNVRAAARGAKCDVRLVQGIVDVAQDGIIGPRTRAALKKNIVLIQRVLLVDDDGVWGPKTDSAYLAMRKQFLNKF